MRRTFLKERLYDIRALGTAQEMHTCLWTTGVSFFFRTHPSRAYASLLECASSASPDLFVHMRWRLSETGAARGWIHVYIHRVVVIFYSPPREMSTVRAFVVNKIVKIRINGDNCKHGAGLSSQRGFYKVIK